MTQATATHVRAGAANPAVRHPVPVAVALSAAMTIVLLIKNTNDGPAWRVSLVLAAAVALFSWLVFGVAVKRALGRESRTISARRSLMFGVVTVLSLAAFWLALPPIFAVAAFVLASHAASHGPSSWPARAGSVLGALGLVAALVLTVLA